MARSAVSEAPKLDFDCTIFSHLIPLIPFYIFLAVRKATWALGMLMLLLGKSAPHLW